MYVYYEMQCAMSEPPLKKYKVTIEDTETNNIKTKKDDLKIIVHPTSTNPYYDGTSVNIIAYNSNYLRSFSNIRAIKFASD